MKRKLISTENLAVQAARPQADFENINNVTPKETAEGAPTSTDELGDEHWLGDEEIFHLGRS